MFSHLQQARESYCQHLCAAWWISGKLLVASVKCFIHGIHTDIYVTSAISACKDVIELRQTPKHIKKFCITNFTS